jgi:hypothetical protein
VDADDRDFDGLVFTYPTYTDIADYIHSNKPIKPNKPHRYEEFTELSTTN